MMALSLIPVMFVALQRKLSTNWRTTSETTSISDKKKRLELSDEKNASVFQKAAKLLTFDNKEVSLFKVHAKFMVPNPRKIKRITNIYRVVRLLADDEHVEIDEATKLHRKLLLWIVLIEQWPVRMAWLLQVLKDDENSDYIFFKEPKRTLYDIYIKYVEARVYDTKINFGPTALAESYHRVFILDADPALFDALLKESKLTYQDVGGGVNREKTKLSTYTINMNPALQAVVAGIASHREEIDLARSSVPKRYVHRSVTFVDSVSKYIRAKPSSYTTKDLIIWIKSLSLGNEDSIIKNIIDYNIDGAAMDTIIRGINGTGADHLALEKLGVTDLGRYQLIALWNRDYTNLLHLINDLDVNGTGADIKNSNINPSDRDVTTGSNSNYHFEPKAKRRDETPNDSVVKDVPSKDLNSMERTTDDKSGRDHIGYTNYAVALSLLIQYGISAPTTFGLYATWGTGKSFIMNKCVSSLKMLWLRDKVKLYIKDPEEVKLFETNIEKLLQDDENEISNLYDWCLLGCPDDAVKFIEIVTSDENEGTERGRHYTAALKLDESYIQEQLSIYYNTEFQTMAEVFKFLFGIVIFLYDYIVSTCYRRNKKVENYWWIVHRLLKEAHRMEIGHTNESTKQAAKTSSSMNEAKAKQTNKSKEETKRKILQFVNIKHISNPHFYENIKTDDRNDDDDDQQNFEMKQNDLYDYEFIWWNAWLYSGSDNLWAGLIKALYETVEKRYGPVYCNAQKQANVYKIVVLVLIAGLLLIAGIIVASLTSFLTSSNHFITYIISIAGSVLVFASSVFAVGSAVWSAINTPARLSEQIMKDVASDIRSKLGFMASVKEELYRLGAMLSNPSHLPGVWDYLIPNAFMGMKPSIVKHCKSFFGGENHRGKRPCKLIIFVDDLDRCQPEKVVEVLQALVLLTENTPFVVFLAVDPRIIVTAIESVHESFFSAAGISGYEYLDKIVNIPFAIPSLVQSEKSLLVEGYMLDKPKSPIEIYIERAHNDLVHIVKFSSDGSQILTASFEENTKVNVWNAYNGILENSFQSKYNGYRNIWEGVVWSPDDSKVIARTHKQGYDVIEMFDSISGDVLQSTDLIRKVNSIAISPDRSKIFVAVNHTKDIFVYKGDDLSTLLYLLQGHVSLCNVIRFSSNGYEIASGDDASRVNIWNVNTKQNLHVYNCRMSCIFTLAYHPDGKTLVVGGDNHLCIFNTQDFSYEKKVDVTDLYEIYEEDYHYSTTIKSISFHPDGSMFAAAIGNAININVFHTATCTVMYRFVESATTVLTAVSWSPDGKRLAYGSKKGALFVRKISKDRLVND